jgi:hypothetical protein
MTEHLSEQQIRSYRERTLSAIERMQVSDHVAACEDCRRRLRGEAARLPAAPFLVSELQATLTAEPEHLTFEEMAAYVDGNASPAEREIVASHIETCPQCVGELRELRGFRAMLSTYPQQTLTPDTPPSFWAKMRAFWRLPAGQFTLRTALPVAAVLLIGLYFQFLRPQAVMPKSGNAGLAQEVARLKRTQQEAQQQVAQAEQQSKRYRQEAQAERSLRESLAAEKARLAKQLAMQATSTAPRQIARNLVQDSQGNLKLQVPVRKQDQALVVAALTQGKLNFPASVDALLSDHSVMMGTANTSRYLTLVSPVSTFVLTEHPTLRWKPVAGAVRYQVNVVRAGRQPVVSASLQQNGDTWQASVSTPDKATTRTYTVAAGTEWTVPLEVAPLKPGVTYRWSVEAYDRADADAEPIKRAPEAARFAVLDAQQRAEVERTQAEYAGSPLLLGVFYASHGLLEEARHALEAQLRLQPKDADALRLLKALDKQQAMRPQK